MNPVPRISTRGYYDKSTGRTIKKNRYYKYPKKYFKELSGSKELVIMVHGLRNNNAGAVAKTLLAQDQLRMLGYTHPVIGFSYDSNTLGAHLARHAEKALAVGQRIARKNGRNLGMFIRDFKDASPDTKIRLIGHSLGSQVIVSTVSYLARKGRKNLGIIESIHFFGASISDNVLSSEKHGKKLHDLVNKKIVNYYAPSDKVLEWAAAQKHAKKPLGLNGVTGKPFGNKYRQKRVGPENHRFASYAATLSSFP